MMKVVMTYVNANKTPNSDEGNVTKRVLLTVYGSIINLDYKAHQA